MITTHDSFFNTAWHTLSIADLSKKISTNIDRGLSVDEAKNRLEEFGLNQVTAAKRTSAFMLLLAQFKNLLIIILLLAAGMSGFLGHGVEAAAITIIVLFAVLLGFAQEFRAERAIDALKKMAAPTATVLRGGEEIEMEAHLIVPGDIIILAAGDRVPADGRVIESVNIKSDEAALTGESVPVEKHSDALPTAELPIGDRHNVVHAGTIITYGRGRAIVTGTGMHTEFGKIAGLLQTVETGDTPLQKNLDRVGKALAIAALVITVCISGIGILQGQSLLDMFIFGIALAVAVVPEALPAVVTISLALGVQRMVKRNALVRRLPAVETLGSTSVICSDKTGTLTKDEMTVRQMFVAGQTYHISGNGYDPIGEFSVNDASIESTPAINDLLVAGILCNDSSLAKTAEGWDIKGDPTEGALVVLAAKAGLQKEGIIDTNPRIAEIPFTSETKRMTTLHQSGDAHTAYAKGAYEIIVDACSSIRTADGIVDLTDDHRSAMLDAAKTMAEHSLRVLGIAKKEHADLQNSEKDMIFLGIVGMIDPPRPEAKDAIQKCKQAGIRVIMITGDHPATATAIAKELGILTEGKAIAGTELDAMNDREFDACIGTNNVYARVSPEHKLKIVSALQKSGHIVAMTGDGVNDAPALKKADIGIAMGITGTDVTKEAAAMTLTDDNFASIVAAVEEGRGIFGNIKKYLMYLLSSNVGEILLMTIATILGMPLPLSAVQILYVNLATDGFPALALAVDPAEYDLMKRPPRDPRSTIFSRSTIVLMLAGGVWSMIINITLFAWALSSGRTLAEAMTMAFLSLVFIQFFKAYTFRSDHASVFEQPFSNKWLNLSIVFNFALLIPIIHWSVLQRPFETVDLSIATWIMIGAASLTIVPVLELSKWYVRHHR